MQKFNVDEWGAKSPLSSAGVDMRVRKFNLADHITFWMLKELQPPK